MAIPLPGHLPFSTVLSCSFTQFSGPRFLGRTSITSPRENPAALERLPSDTFAAGGRGSL